MSTLVVILVIASTYIAFIIGGYFFDLVKSAHERRRAIKAAEDRQERVKRFEASLSTWLATDEPKYRYYRGYPPDWTTRRIYVFHRDKYLCQICGKSELQANHVSYNDMRWEHLLVMSGEKRTGLHVHHKLPISRGGSNDLSNLITLCQNCHEDQHPHLLRPKLDKYKDKARRARKPDIRRFWEARAGEVENKLETSRPED